MHHALEIAEILSNIFAHCGWPEDEFESTSQLQLARLARTCRAFKDLALDVLWEELEDLSPLAQCLPHAHDELFSDEQAYSCGTQAEWNNLQSYTCRIRYIMDLRRGLDEKSFKILSNPPTAEPLFPNLRSLACTYKSKWMHLLHLRFPSLVSLDVYFKDPRWFQDSLSSFPEHSPDIRSLSLYVGQSNVAFDTLVSNCICRWRNLHTVTCSRIALDADALAHLSHMPLSELEFTLGAALRTPDSPLSYSDLREFALRAESCHLVARLLPWIRLPAIEHFAIIIDSCPTRRELISCLAGVQASRAGQSLVHLQLIQNFSVKSNVVHSEALLLGLEDLRPCMALGNLTDLTLNIEWGVALTDGELSTLASAWPKLKSLHINCTRGWNTQGGITLDGLVQLLTTCRSLSQVALALDTRNCTELPGSLGSLQRKMPCCSFFNVLDSIIEAESIPTIVAFFAGILRPPHFSVYGWLCERVVMPEGWEVYRDRWQDVSRQVEEVVGDRRC